MRAKDPSALASSLLPGFPGFAAAGPLLYFSPAKHILRGVYVESPDFDATSFYLWTFWMLPSVPAKHLSPD